jgi:hypothetical protein
MYSIELKGKSASEFIKLMEANKIKPKIDFSKQIESMKRILQKAKI